MPTMKSSTLSEDYRSLLKEKAAEGDYLFLLKELLAVIHRDGGQYTLLTGLTTSFEDAVNNVINTRVELRTLKRGP